MVRHGALAGAFLAALLAVGAPLGRASAQPLPVAAKVIWAHAGRVYIAAADSLPLEEGDLLTFSSGKKVVGSGVVSAVHDRVLAVARVTSGSLDRVKKLDRLAVRAERPPMRPMPALRVGIPTRANLLFACEGWSLRPPISSASYSSEVSGPTSYGLVRDSSDARTGLWPDTLLVRLFEESADEEIALERGELDVAIFWPGELSTAMREDPKWRDFVYGARSPGLLAALVPRDAVGGGLAAADSAAIVSLNRELFRGDLRMFPFPDLPAARGTPGRFEVDRSSPGWQTIERFLNRGKDARAVPGEPSPIRVTLLDTPTDPPQVPGATAILFGIRCPVVSAPNLRRYLRALGPDALVDMLDCRPARREP